MSWYNPMTWFNSSAMTGKSIGHQSYSDQKKRFFSLIDGKEVYFELNTLDDYRVAYSTCSPLKAIINKRAQMFLNGEIQVLNKNTDNNQRGEKAKLLRSKLKKPNIIQSWRQFWAQFHIYLDLYGYCPVIKIKVAGMDEISSLWCIPPWIFNVEFTGKWMNQTELKGIYKRFYLSNNKDKNLPLDDVCLVLDSSISTDNEGNVFLPDPRLKGSQLDISNTQAAKQSRNTLITKKGAIGILSNIGKDAAGPVKLEKKDKDALQADFRRYGITGQDWQVIMTDSSLQWQAMTFPTKELMLFEETEDNILRMCDTVGLYSDLMGTIKKSTFANQNEAKKAQYQDYLIPDGQARIEQLSDFLVADDKNAYLWISFDHVEVLQQSKKERGDAFKVLNEVYKELWAAGLCTKADWATALELPPPKENGDKYIYELESGTAPLAVSLGVGGTESLMKVLSSSMQAEQKKQVLIKVFGIKDSDAELMAGEDLEQETTPGANGVPNPKLNGKPKNEISV